jgi:hypothetical protein
MRRKLDIERYDEFPPRLSEVGCESTQATLPADRQSRNDHSLMCLSLNRFVLPPDEVPRRRYRPGRFRVGRDILVVSRK